MRQLRTPILLAILAVTAALVYAPALDGPLLSDDHSYFTHNPYLSPLSRANLVALVDPFGPVAQLTANWAPVHVLAHAVGFHFFGPVTRGHHVVNVLVHLLNTGLLLALLRQNRVPWVLAAAGAALFLVHPANVEAVAWISQLKSSLATALGLAALLAHPRIPLLGAALFVLALLTKPTALAFLAFLVVWCLQEARAGRPAQWGWLGAWALLRRRDRRDAATEPPSAISKAPR